MPNSLAGLKHGLTELGVWLETRAIDPDTDNRVRLVFEEIVTNVIRYGFSDQAEHSIHAAIQMRAGDLTLHFDDDGRAFDPTFAPELAPAGSLAEASIGGRGLMLVRAASSRISYERTLDGFNRLAVTLSIR
jgi:serine/threonine-protein kinase RsbW